MKSTDIVVTPMGVRVMGRKLPCTVGRGGLTDRKAVGDMATPRGVHRIVGVMYRPDRMARPTDWALPIKPGDLWSDAVTDDNYNLMVRVPHPYSHEDLRRADPMYDLVIVTDWNWPNAVKGRGSAIFMHQWRGKGRPTAGCVAFRRDHLRWVAAQIRHETRLVIA